MRRLVIWNVVIFVELVVLHRLLVLPYRECRMEKKAGERCIQLDENNRCKIFLDSRRPKVCGALAPEKEMCGHSRDEALKYLEELERLTSPS